MDHHFKLIDCKAHCATLTKPSTSREKLVGLVSPAAGTELAMPSATPSKASHHAAAPEDDDVDEWIQREQIAVMRSDEEHRDERAPGHVRVRPAMQSSQVRANPW